MSAKTCIECGCPASHHGAKVLCCKCYIEQGGTPADWHPGCMKAYKEKQALAATPPSPPTGTAEAYVTALARSAAQQKPYFTYLYGSSRQSVYGKPVVEAQDVFDLTIGRLDHVLSLLVNWTKAGDQSEPNKQTLKHHAEDMIAAGECMLKILKKTDGAPQPDKQSVQHETPLTALLQLVEAVECIQGLLPNPTNRMVAENLYQLHNTDRQIFGDSLQAAYNAAAKVRYTKLITK